MGMLGQRRSPFLQMLVMELFSPSPQQINMYTLSAWIQDLVTGDSEFDDVRLRLYSLQPFCFSGVASNPGCVKIKKSGGLV